MPPNMNELPLPQNENSNEKVESKDIESLFNQVEEKNQSEKKTIDSDTEKSLIEKIKSN